MLFFGLGTGLGTAMVVDGGVVPLEAFHLSILERTFDDVVLGGDNARKLTRLPTGCRMGADANAFLGGFRLWEDAKT